MILEERREGLCPCLLNIFVAFDIADDLFSCFLKFFLPQDSVAFKEFIHLLFLFWTFYLFHWTSSYHLLDVGGPLSLVSALFLLFFSSLRAAFSVWMTLNILVFLSKLDFFLEFQSFMSRASQSPQTQPVKKCNSVTLKTRSSFHFLTHKTIFIRILFFSCFLSVTVQI